VVENYNRNERAGDEPLERGPTYYQEICHHSSILRHC
jgi:hypothetical protein